MQLKNALITGLLLTFITLSSKAQETPPKEENKTPPPLAELTKELTAYPGFFDMYRDPKNGSGLLVIKESQLNTPIIYFVYTVNGLLDIGHFTGNFRENRVIEFRKDFNRIDIVAKTPRYYFDPESPLSRAADKNIGEAVLVSLPVKNSDNDIYAIDLEGVFKNESMHNITPAPLKDPKKEKERFQIGKLSADKSRVERIESFEKNSLIEVKYVFENPNPLVGGGPEVSDPRYSAVTIQHALIELPQNNYQPRRDDPRIGYFTEQFDDQTRLGFNNYRDVINRWDLQKKDPTAEVSDPITPIVWWIENTTPHKWRDTIKEALLLWNTSFEKVGISNAIQVKIQPDDATWSAEDIRYNVLRWTSSPRPPFGGYGPSVKNPLTGEIIAADIMLEFIFIQARGFQEQLMGREGHDSSPRSSLHCSMGYELGNQMAMAASMNLTPDDADPAKSELVRQALHYLILHEVGHTLGLNHNMKGSQLYGPDEVHDKSITQGVNVNSVMEYPALNFAPPGVTQGDYYIERPGPYDDWAIAYGYSIGLSDPEAEESRLSAILARSTEPQLMFGNDADDMRAPGRHIDPRVNINDLSSDPVTYAEGRIALVMERIGKLHDTMLKDGNSHSDFLLAVKVLFNQLKQQSDIASRQIGGIYINRAVVGQEGYTQPYEPVPESKQQKAMALLASTLFAPDFLAPFESVYAYMQPQRRGFSYYGKNEDPKLHDMLLTAQKSVFAHLLHPAVMQRLSDSALYGNTYSLSEMIMQLTDAVFMADIKKSVNSFRRNLQIEYVKQLIAISGLDKASQHDYLSQAASVSELTRIYDWVKSSRGDAATKMHKQYLAHLIEAAMYKSNL